MAQQVRTKLELESGKKIARYKKLTIVQDLFCHHRFELTVPFQELENKDEIFFQQSHKDVCGKSLSISFESVTGNKPFGFRFRGIITEIMLSNLSDFSNVFVIRGYSPTLLLEDYTVRRTFIKKNVQQIFDSVLNDYPGNIIKKKLNPAHQETISYAVQYDETNFAFLSRLAAEYGEWFYYNGQEILLGSPRPAQEVDFVIDGNQSFDMSIALMPAKFSMSAYDYRKDQSYSGRSSGQAVEGLGQFTRFALDESENLFSQEAPVIAAKPVSNQHGLDEQIRFRRSMVASNLIVFHGRGENPDLMIGSVISAGSTKPENGGRGSKESIGKYRITEITHAVDSNGNYSNVFKAVPETARYPPVNPYVIQPAGQPELATVNDNNDPDKMSRVKVSFNWPGKEKGSDWIRVGSFYSGGDDRKGIQFIPEKDAQVMIGYELDKPELPFVISSFFPKKEGMRSRRGNNEEKAIYTRAGNLIELIDKHGENQIRITNVNKDDTALLISFQNNGVISLKTKGKIEIDAQENISVKAGKKISLEAQEIEMKAENKLSLTAVSVHVDADATVEIKANASAKLSSANTEISGDALTTIKGGLVKIN